MNQRPWHLIPPCTEPVSTVYRDEHLWVINKPAFLLSVPGRGPEKQDCVLNRLLKQEPEVRLVHRLDLDTSGLMVFAIGKPAQSALGRAFQARQVEKTYEAVVQGRVDENEGKITFPLIADWANRPRQKVCYEKGKSALTRFNVMHRLEDATYLRLHPHTGRSHQLRIHCREFGHPILGCDLYSPPEVEARSDRLLLHATALSLPHPEDGRMVEFVSQAPFSDAWAER